MADIEPMALQEGYGSEECGGKNGTKSEDLMPVDESCKKLAVHALMAIIAENGGVRAGKIVEAVMGTVLELAAFVIACEHSASWYSAWS